MNAHSFDFMAEEALTAPVKPRRIVSAETRAKQSEAARRRQRTPEERARISAGLRQHYGEPDSRLKGLYRVLTPEEAGDFRILRSVGKYSVREALVMTGRRDLLNYEPTPQPPRKVYRMLSSDERLAFWNVWREAESWEHGLVLIGRGDLL